MTKTSFKWPAFILWLWIAHYVAVITHEYSHSLLAGVLGDKSNPWLIDWGGSSLSNILLLNRVDENVDYAAIFAQGLGWHVALISAAGMAIGNLGGYLLSARALARESTSTRIHVFSFFFWLNFMSIANFYDYIPVRTLTTRGDVAHFVAGSGVPSWVVLLLTGPIVGWTVYLFFSRTLLHAFRVFGVENNWRNKRTLLIVCAYILFVYFGTAGQNGYGYASHWISRVQLLLLPLTVWMFWPKRADSAVDCSLGAAKTYNSPVRS